MPISGPVVHQQLMDACQQLQSSSEMDHGEIHESREQRDRLFERRGEAMIHLAEHYLPELTPEAIRQTWSEIREPISQILFRKEDHARRVAEALERLTSQRGQEEQQLIAISAELDRAVDQQQQVAAQVEQRLREDDQFVALSDRAAIAEAALQRAEANLEEIDQDAARKLPAYEDSTLFRYLDDRGYGTAEYGRRGFTRRMDRMLAGFIDFNRAKQGYDFLRTTPEQMRKIIAEDRQALDVVMDELERRRDDVAQHLGLPEKIETASQLDRQRGERLESLERLRRQIDESQREFADLQDTRGTYYRQAVKLFRETMEGSDSHELKQRAEKTSEITDDQIVARLMGVEAEIDQLQDSVQHRRRALDQKRSFIEDLGRVVQRFRAAQFDSSRSQFIDSLDVFEEVARAEQDYDAKRLWDRIRSAQRWGPHAAEKVTRAASEPLAQVLIHAMAHAADKELESQAEAAGNRRAGRHSSRKRS